MNQKFQRTYLVVLLSFICLFAFAQGKQVSGIVKDTSGEPVIGANVIVKGTTNGTITGIDGDFTLSNMKKSDVIVFTFIGYKAEEVKYNGQSSVNVTLQDDTELLDEVVVIGYGTVNKRDLTGSVASVKAEDIAAVPVSSAVEALTGKLAGVNITTTEATNDSITLDGISAQTASLTTDNGRIEVSNFNGSTLSGTTRNGKITMSGVTSQNVAATIQNSGTLKLENISANVCNAKVQNGSITGSVIGSGSSYGFELAAGGGKIRVSDANDKNFVFFGKDTLQQNADAPNKLNLATKNGDVEVEFVR